MNDELRAAHDLLLTHAQENGDSKLTAALHDLAVDEKWEEPTAAEIAHNIRIN